MSQLQLHVDLAAGLQKPALVPPRIHTGLSSHRLYPKLSFIHFAVGQLEPPECLNAVVSALLVDKSDGLDFLSQIL